MKNFILIVSLLLIACSPQKNVSNRAGVNHSKSTFKGMKMYGKVVAKSTTSIGNKSEEAALYFDNGVSYLINFSASTVSKAELQSKIYQDIDIIGEIKTGFSPSQNQNSKREGQSEEEGQYIVIYKVL